VTLARRVMNKIHKKVDEKTGEKCKLDRFKVAFVYFVLDLNGTHGP
jgi:hypothetical protein